MCFIDYLCEGNITIDDIAIAQRHRWLNDKELQIEIIGLHLVKLTKMMKMNLLQKKNTKFNLI